MEEQLNLLIERYPKLAVCKEDIKKAYELLEVAYRNGRKLLVCGNGGSASDSEHIVGELMKEFKLIVCLKLLIGQGERCSFAEMAVLHQTLSILLAS